MHKVITEKMSMWFIFRARYRALFDVVGALKHVEKVSGARARTHTHRIHKFRCLHGNKIYQKLYKNVNFPFGLRSRSAINCRVIGACTLFVNRCTFVSHNYCRDSAHNVFASSDNRRHIIGVFLDIQIHHNKK